MLATCTEPGCTTLVLGVGVCIAHQTAATHEFVRGRPFDRANMPVGAVALVSAASGATPASPPLERKR